MTISGTVSDALTEVTVTISVDGLVFTPTIAGDGTFSQAISLIDEGLYPVTVTAEDEAGNSTRVTRNILFTLGTISINQGAEITTTTAVKLALDYYPTASKMRFCYNNLSWTAWEVYAPTKSVAVPAGDGIKTIYVQFLNAQGEGSEIYFDSIILDSKAPVGALTINNGAASTTTTEVTLSLVATDANGVAKMQFSNDNRLWSDLETFSPSKAWTLAGTTYGIKTVYARFVDYGGKVSAVVTDTITYAASAVGHTLGQVTIKGGAQFTTTAAVPLTLTLPGPEFTQMALSLNGTTWLAWGAYLPTKTVTLPAGDGVKTVNVKFRTAAGSVSETYSDTIILDSKAPVGTIQINSGAATTNNRNVVLTLTANDLNGVSGIGMQFSLNGTTWTEPEAFAASKAITLPNGEGIKTVRVKFIDEAGVVSLIYTDTILVDTLAATSKVVIAAGAASTRTATVTLTLTNLGSPLQMSFSNDGSSWSPWEPIGKTRTGYKLESASDGIKTVSVKLRDAAGNVSAPFSDTIIYDTTRPTGTVLIKGSEPSDTYSKSAAVKLQLTKNDLSSVQVRYRTYNGPLPSAWGGYVAYPATNTLAVTLPAGSGPRSVEIQYKDAVGHESDLTTPIIDSIILDPVAPVLPVGTKVKLNNDASTVDYSAAPGASGLLPLTLTVPTPTEATSGMAAILWSANNLTWTEAAWVDGTFAINYPLAAPSVKINKTIYVKLKDRAGNLSVAYTDAILVTP